MSGPACLAAAPSHHHRVARVTEVGHLSLSVCLGAAPGGAARRRSITIIIIPMDTSFDTCQLLAPGDTQEVGSSNFLCVPPPTHTQTNVSKTYPLRGQPVKAKNFPDCLSIDVFSWRQSFSLPFVSLFNFFPRILRQESFVCLWPLA